MLTLLSPINLSMARTTQLSMLMRYSPRPLAFELAHKLDAMLKICQLTTDIPLTPVCMTFLATIIMITRVMHAHFFLLPPRGTVTAVAAECDAGVKRDYASTNVHKMERVTTTRFHTAVDKTDAAHQLARSIKLAIGDILVRCDHQCFDGLETTTWVPRWKLPLRKCTQKALTPDKPSTFDVTNTFDDFFPTDEPGSPQRCQRPGYIQVAAPPHQRPLRPRRPNRGHSQAPLLRGSHQNAFHELFSGFSLVDSVRHGQ